MICLSQWWQVDKVSPIKLFDENKSLAGLNLRHLLFQQGRVDYVRRAVDHVFALWGEGKVKPLVDSTWALEDVRDFVFYTNICPFDLLHVFQLLTM